MGNDIVVSTREEVLFFLLAGSTLALVCLVCLATIITALAIDFVRWRRARPTSFRSLARLVNREGAR